ncbi:MAG: tetratricopeptide repeat protein [Planctomycetales bacterium]
MLHLLRHRLTVGATLLALVIQIGTPRAAQARGGMGWGRQSGYNVGANFWQFASPWGALMGMGVPSRNLNAPNFNDGNGPQSRNSTGGSGGSWRTQPTMSRSQMFPGSSSQPSTVGTSFQSSYTPRRYQAAPASTFSVESSFEPPYTNAYNTYWHHGYWGGGQWGWGNWGGGLGIWSFPRWWVGALYYFSGYGLYQNPFLDKSPAGTPAHLDYSKPIPLDAPDEGSGSTAEEESPADDATPFSDSAGGATANGIFRTPEMVAGLRAFDAAREAFQKRNLPEALTQIETALQALPHDPALHEFRALVQFAQGNYRAAAQTLYAVLSVSPGWNWTTLGGMYADQEDYTKDLRQLENYRKQHDDAADAAFVLAYHYTTCRHAAAAVRQLTAVTKLLPQAELPPPLNQLIAGGVKEDKTPAAATSGGNSPRTATPPANSAPPLSAAKLAGTWKATRGPVQIELALGDDRRFTWIVTQQDKSIRLEGQYGVDGNLLMLYGDGRAMIGRASPLEKGGFNFKLSENDPADPGLDFFR